MSSDTPPPKKVTTIPASKPGEDEVGPDDRLGRWDWNIQTDTLEWAGPVFRIFGIAPEDFHGDVNAFYDRVHPDDRERVEEAVRKSLEEGEPYGIYHRIIRPDGEVRIIHEQAEVIRDGDARPLHMRGTVEDITEWRQTLEALRLRDAAIESCITPIIMVDGDLRFSYVNTAFVEMVGAGDESFLLGKPAAMFVEEPELLNRAVAEIRRKGTWQGTLKARSLDGRLFPTLSSAALVRGSGELSETVVVSLLDLTDLRERERELRRWETELTETLSSIEVAIYRDWFRCGDFDPHPGFVSPPIEHLVGRSSEELTAAPELWFELVHPDDLERTKESLRRIRSTGLPAMFRYRVRHSKSGETRWIEESARPEVDGNGELVGVFGTLRDITEQKRGEEQRLLLEKQITRVAQEWSQTFDSIELPIFVVRWSGTIRRLNQAAASLLENGFANALDRKFDAIGRGEPWRTAAKMVNNIRKTGDSVFREVQDSSGATWHLTVATSRLVREQKEQWMVAVFRDVTQLYRLQETVRHNEKMSAMGALVGRVAHEVRNPLFGISATVDALTAEFGSDDGLAEYIQVLRSELDRLGSLMEDLLDYARPIDLKKARVSLEHVVGEAISACAGAAQSAGVSLRKDFSPNLPLVEIDADKLQQVFRNLLENAVQHSETGSAVQVRVERPQREEGIRVRIEDRGPGFGPEDPQRLVEPFYSRRPGGTGLGLWIVQRILAEHGGDLRLSNRETVGAVAEVRLPATSGASGP